MPKRNTSDTRTRKAAPKSRRSRRPKTVKVPVWAALGAAALIITLLAIPVMRRPRIGSGAGAKLPDISFSGLGIDISHHNAGPIIWDSLFVMTDRDGGMTRSKEKAQKVYHVKFVLIKASEGAGMKDPKFKEYWKQAGEQSIQRGAYHFFRSSKSGAVQAANFIAAVGKLRHSDLPPVLDIETIHLGCSRKMLNERALEWLRIVGEHYGRTPVVYASDYYLSEVLSKDITEHYPLWVAHYGVESPVREEWDYWQFTESATVYGVPGAVDLSIRR